MKLSRFLFMCIGLPALLLSGWEQWNGEWTTASQREFARQCYSVGGAWGHTLAGIAWMESSLGAIQDHGEPSYGPFGLSLGVMEDAYPNLSLSALIDKAENDFEWAARLALKIFKNHYRVLREYGFDPGPAWKYAYQRFNAGFRWRRVAHKGDLFNERVKFLKTVF